MDLKLPDFSKARLLVIGDLMLDRYWHGSTSRISPEAPVPVVKVGEEEQRPGGAGNVALNIASLGCQVDLIGLTGDDAAADDLEKQLSSDLIHCNFMRIMDKSTITKLRIISRHQQLIRLDFEDGFSGFDEASLLQCYSSALPQADAVVLSDYGKGALDNAAELIRLARAQGKPVLVDPKGSDFSRYQGCTLITPNQSEFEAVAGTFSSDDEFTDKAMMVMNDLQLDALLVTRSERGMSLVQQQEDVLHLPTQAREVYDVTGAGDTVISVLAAGVAAGQSLATATQLSNLAAGVVVGKLGTACVSPHELRRAIQDDQRTHSAVVDVAHLNQLVEDAQAHGEKVVMTNGCFDILHAGHVSYLCDAKKLGQRLIVAVNDDQSVKRLKGDSRPVNALAQRMEVLAALESVDWVVSFSEDTPQTLICEVLPDILVKGGDYKAEEIAGGQCVREKGGEVVILGFVDGCSTSRIIDSIQSSHE